MLRQKARQRLWYKLLAILLALVMELPSFVWIQPVKAENAAVSTIQIETQSVQQGKEATIGLWMRNIPSPGLAGYRFKVTYDPNVIEYSGFSTTNQFDNPFVNPETPGELLLTAAKFDGIGVTGDVNLANLKFKAVGQVGQVSPLNLTIIEVSDAELNEIIQVDITSGSIAIKDSNTLPPLEILPITLPEGMIDGSYAYPGGEEVVFHATGGLPPYNWQSEGLPEGLTLSTDGKLTGIPKVSGNFPVQFIVQDSNATPNVKNFSTQLLIKPQPMTAATIQVDDLNLQAGTQGLVGVFAQGIGGIGLAGYHFRLTYDSSVIKVLSVNPTDPDFEPTANTSIPGEVLLDSVSTTGKGKTGDLHLFDLAVEAIGQVGQETRITLQVLGFVDQNLEDIPYSIRDGQVSVELQALQIKTLALPDGVIGTPYNGEIEVSGGEGPYTYSSSNLPAGISLESSQGTLSGTPTQIGNFTVTIQVYDSSGQSVTQDLSMAIRPTPLVLAANSVLPEGSAGLPYEAGPLTVTGGAAPYQWSVSETSLPPGLVMDTLGKISGTPTAGGLYPVILTVKDSANPAQSLEVTLPIRIKAPLLAILTTSLPDGQLNQAYQAKIQTSGGLSPLTYTALGLPEGLTLDSLTGDITGIPTQEGTYNIFTTVQAADNQLQSINFKMTITSKLTFYLKDSPQETHLPLAQVGDPYQVVFAASGGKLPIIYGLAGTTLPKGLMLDPLTGVISGIPLEKGSYDIQITASDYSNPAQSQTQTFSLDIIDRIKLSPSPLPSAQTGQNYSQYIGDWVSGGSGNYTWDVQGLPVDFAFNPLTQEIEGNSALAHIYPLTIKVTDNRGNSTETAVYFIVQQATPQWSELQDNYTGEQINSIAWTPGGSQDFTQATLKTYAGDELILKGTYLPDTATAVLLGTGTEKRSWTLQSLVMLDTLTGILPKDLPAGKYILTVAIPDGPYSDQAAMLDLNSSWYVTSQLEPFGNQSKDAVTENLTLPTTIPNMQDLNLTWSSSQPSIVEPSGILHQPDFKTGDQGVTLTATITWGQSPEILIQTKRFNFTVKAAGPTEQDRVSRAAENLKALMPDQTLLNALVDGQEKLTLPVKVQDNLEGGQEWPVMWEVTDLNGLPMSQYIEVDAGGLVSVLTRPTIEEGDQEIQFIAQLSNSTFSTRQSFAGRILAQTKTPSELADQLNALSNQISNPDVPLDMSLVSSSFNDLMKSALDSTNTLNTSTNDPTVTSLINQMRSILDSLLNRLTPPPQLQAKKMVYAEASDQVSDQEIAAVLEKAIDAGAAVALRSDFNAQTLEEGVNALHGVLSPAVLEELARFKASSDPNIQDSFQQILDKLQEASNRINNLAQETYRIIVEPDGTIRSGIVEGTAASLEAIMESLKMDLQTIGESSVETNLQVTTPISQLKLAASDLASLMNHQLGLSMSFPGSQVQLPVPMIQDLQVDPSGILTINAKPILVSDPKLVDLPESSQVIGLPYHIDLTQNGSEIPVNGWDSSPAEVGLSLNDKVSVSSLSEQINQHKLEVRYYDTSRKVWAKLNQPNLRVDVANRQLIFFTPHIADFIVTTIASDSSLKSLTLRVGNEQSQELLPVPFTVTAPVNQSLTMDILPRDPQATIQVDGQNLMNNGTGGYSVNYEVSVGKQTIEIKVTAEDGTSTPYSVTIVGINPLTVAQMTLPQAMQGNNYQVNLFNELGIQGGVGNYTLEIPELPPGLSLTQGTSVEGVPVQPGDYILLVTIKDDGTPQQTMTESITLKVESKPLHISVLELPSALLGQSYFAELTVDGGITPYQWSLESGDLPPGLSLTSSGLITGTVAENATGTYTATVKVIDQSGKSQTQSMSIPVNLSILEIKTKVLPNATPGTPYYATLVGKGGVAPYTWNILNKPEWLTLDSQTGAITGTPTQAGSLTLQVELKDSQLPMPITAGPVNIELNIESAPLQITTSSLTVGAIGKLYEAQLNTSGGAAPYTWSVTGLPDSFTFDPASGLIRSTEPLSAALEGEIQITVQVTDTEGAQAANTYKLVVQTEALQILTTELSGILGQAISEVLQASGGVEPYTWSIAGLPSGLTLDPNSGVISGQVDTEIQGATMTVTVRDSKNNVHSAEVGLTITQPKIMYGDVDSDQRITVLDALYVLKQVTNPNTLDSQQQKAGDVDGYPGISVLDALYILKHVTNPSVPFPVEK